MIPTQHCFMAASSRRPTRCTTPIRRILRAGAVERFSAWIPARGVDKHARFIIGSTGPLFYGVIANSIAAAQFLRHCHSWNVKWDRVVGRRQCDREGAIQSPRLRPSSGRVRAYLRQPRSAPINRCHGHRSRSEILAIGWRVCLSDRHTNKTSRCGE